MRKHWKGAQVPEATDGLLTSVEAMMDTAGVVTVATSIASARAILTEAVAAGKTVSGAAPVYFDVGGILYKADGSTATDGTLRLKPISENEIYEDSYSEGKTLTTGPGVRTILVTSRLPAKPYDRQVIAWGMVAGSVSDGAYSVGVSVRGTDWQIARINATNSMDTATAFNTGFIPAGTDPQVQLAVTSGTYSSNRLYVSGHAGSNKLTVMAFPITMA